MYNISLTVYPYPRIRKALRKNANCCLETFAAQQNLNKDISDKLSRGVLFSNETAFDKKSK